MGVINLNKPPGITSHQATKKVQRLTGASKAGHAGTLDPEAEGVLIVCLNEATRITEYLASLPKEYLVQIQLGVTTDTYDLTGRVVKEKDPSWINKEDLEKALEHFKGEIEQTPPMYSAIKKDGAPLYKLARKGIVVERKKRRVTIEEIHLLYFSLPEAVLRVRCSKGTYIRSLVNDIGEYLGVGAAVKKLQRTAVGRFFLSEAVTFEEIERGDFKLLSIDEALSHLPILRLKDRQYKLAVHGTGFPIHGAYPSGTILRLAGPDGRTFGIGRVQDHSLRIEKVLIPL